MAGETQAASMADFDSMMDAANAAADEPSTEPQGEPETPPQDDGRSPAEEPETKQADPEDSGDGDQTEDDDESILEGESAPPSAEDVAAAASKWRELADSESLPADLMSKLVMSKQNGQEVPITIEEAVRGYQRLSEGTRRSQQLDAREAQIANNEQAQRQWFESIKEPAAFLETFERNLGPEVIDRALEIRLEQIRKDNEMIEAAGWAAMRRYGVDDVNDSRVVDAMREMREERNAARVKSINDRKLQASERNARAQLEQQNGSKRTEELRDLFRRQLDQLVPPVFKAIGLRVNDKSKHLVIENLKYLMGTRKLASIDKELLLEAARITKEEEEDRASSRTPKAPKGGNGAAKPAGRQGAAAGTAPTRGSVQNDRTRPRTMAEFNDFLGIDD